MAKEKMFKTMFDGHERKFMNPGTVEFPIRKARKKDGMLTVDDTEDMFNMHDYIQSFADSVDIEVLLKRFQAGDQSAIEQFTHQYGDYLDLADIPDNFNDMMALAKKGEDMFNALPIEKKQLFDNNYETFVSTVGSKEWMEKMGYESENKVVEPIKEVAGDSPAAEK